MKKQKFFAARKTKNGDLERIETEGYMVELDGYTFFISGGGGYSWSVTEGKSGMLIGIYGSTRKQAIDRLQVFDLSKLEQFDLDKLNDVMMKLPLCNTGKEEEK